MKTNNQLGKYVLVCVIIILGPMTFQILLMNILLVISRYMNDTSRCYSSNVSVCLEAHSVLHRRVPAGITACTTEECLQASAGVNGSRNGHVPCHHLGNFPVNFRIVQCRPSILRNGNVPFRYFLKIFLLVLGLE